MWGKELVATGVGYGLLKGMTLATVAYAVIGNNDLSATERALIVAVVSGILGIVGVVIGAYMSSRAARSIAHENGELLRELKAMQTQTQDKVAEVSDRQQANGH